MKTIREMKKIFTILFLSFWLMNFSQQQPVSSGGDGNSVAGSVSYSINGQLISK